jgi:hypothetical protein
MMSSMMWACLILSPVTLHSVSSVTPYCRVIWHYSGARRLVHSAVVALQSHYICMSACLACIDYAACPLVLQVHDGSGVRRLGNVRSCLVNT